jgi:hypothetical protein
VRTPVEVVNAAFTALNCEDWAGLADLCDPVSLRAFKREVLDGFPEDEDGLWIDIDDLMEREPDMPREVAEYQLGRMNRYMDPMYRLRSQVYAVRSIAELRDMEPGRVFARWLQARSPEHFPHDDEAEQPWELPELESLGKPTRAYRYTALGSVPDSAEIAYVVYRQSRSPHDIYPGVMDEWEQSVPADEAELARVTHFLHAPQVATCRKQADGSWRLVADSQLLLVGTLEIVAIGDGADN